MTANLILMARPLRIEFAGALYHVTSRGDGREDIYLNDEDRAVWLEVLGEVCNRYNWVCHAYCLMSNHYHILIETPESNLSVGMRQLNGVYTQRFNRLHSRVGHVFQGRYKAILVDKESYLLELARYIVLNPVRARMVRKAQQWRWSSYRATAGFEPVKPWLNVDWLLSSFARRRKTACERYQRFVEEGKGQPSPWESLKNQVFLGSEAFVEQMQTLLDSDKSLDEVPSSQRRPFAKPLSDYARSAESRNEAIVATWLSGGYKMKEIAEYFGLHYSSVSKIIKAHENSQFKT
ncbi:transposase [Gilvimarinus sp. DA14]|uniref:REP-associated tyrosine transposase n=1 Tax=Gilvimarinus sp. DA14 TaxID=2956798 RepID=UPI0020B866ED|nr:transposase [Gilvimarinus sp. DA14]UTF59277.1 transposase [Gilvimarinus sp. DA14]